MTIGTRPAYDYHAPRRGPAWKERGTDLSRAPRAAVAAALTLTGGDRSRLWVTEPGEVVILNHDAATGRCYAPACPACPNGARA